MESPFPSASDRKRAAELRRTADTFIIAPHTVEVPLLLSPRLAHAAPHAQTLEISEHRSQSGHPPLPFDPSLSDLS